MQARKACLLFLAAFSLFGAMTLRAADGATPKPTTLPKLELVAGARVALSPMFINKDSFEVRVRITVPTAAKYQRHRCLITANEKGYKLAVSKSQSWMLKRDTLMALSEVDLTLRAPHALASALVLSFNFINLDQPKAAPGIAMLALVTATKIAEKPTADSVEVKSVGAKIDSAIATQAADSARLAADSTEIKAHAEEGGDVMPWVLMGLLLSGFAVLALLNVLSRRQSRAAMEKITALRPIESNKVSAREEARPSSFENLMRQREQRASSPAQPEHGARVDQENNANEAAPMNAVPAASVLALTPTPRATEEIFALPDLHAALAQLCAVTTEVQKAVGKQFEALQKLSTQVERARLLPAQAASLQNKPRLQFAFEQNEGAKEETAANHRARLEDLGVRVNAQAEPGEKYEEIADAIASLAAASTIKPPQVAAQALAPKLELLQRLHAGLQALAVYCRANGVAAENVESVDRKVHELHMSYEAWAADQNAKLPLMLSRPASGGENARRKIVEALLDGLYETRKLAAQGALYFERRLAQVLEQDLPKLRAQFRDTSNAELQKILEGIA